MTDPQRLLQLAQENLDAGEQGNPLGDPGSGSSTRQDVERLLRLSQMVPGQHVPVVKDIGVVGSFTAGATRGFMEPLTFIRGATALDPRIDEPGERVANFLGNFVGLGVGFIPFAAGTGAALRVAGLATRMSPATYAFVRNTIAGGVQFAGISEDIEDIPKNLAMGIAFGGAIEGVFLAGALRGARAGELAGAEILARKTALAPSDGKTAERIITELDFLSQPGMTYDKALAELTGNHVSTVRLSGRTREGANDIQVYARERFPGAQIESRSYQGGTLHEVLIHNPADPLEHLSPKQVAQWRSTGIAEHQEIIYGSPPRSYEATGVPVGEGRIQIRDPNRPATVFAPLLSDVEKPVLTRFYGPVAKRNEVLAQAVRDSETKVGFMVPSNSKTPGAELRARRGAIDTSDFRSAASLKEFLAPFTKKLAQIEGGSPEEALRTLMRQEGIAGVVIKEEGITTGIHVFDQKAVSYAKEVPRVGQTMDNAVTVADIETGDLSILSLVPSWKNSITASLRTAGIPEKEIARYLDLHVAQVGKKLDTLMDTEFQNLKQAAEAQLGGCV